MASSRFIQPATKFSVNSSKSSVVRKDGAVLDEQLGCDSVTASGLVSDLLSVYGKIGEPGFDYHNNAQAVTCLMSL